VSSSAAMRVVGFSGQRSGWGATKVLVYYSVGFPLLLRCDWGGSLDFAESFDWNNCTKEAKQLAVAMMMEADLCEQIGDGEVRLLAEELARNLICKQPYGKLQLTVEQLGLAMVDAAFAVVAAKMPAPPPFTRPTAPAEPQVAYFSAGPPNPGQAVTTNELEDLRACRIP
jgi:hypothetical protein